MESNYLLTDKGEKLLSYLLSWKRLGTEPNDPEGKALYDEVIKNLDELRSKGG